MQPIFSPPVNKVKLRRSKKLQPLQSGNVWLKVYCEAYEGVSDEDST